MELQQAGGQRQEDSSKDPSGLAGTPSSLSQVKHQQGRRPHLGIKYSTMKNRTERCKIY